MCVPGAIAATSAAIVMHEAGRRGACAGRADEHRDRRARRDHARHDGPGRVEQPTRRAEDEDDEVRAGRVGLIDDVSVRYSAEIG